ncbi:low molecular weight phosphotyrosine protein phosphatase [Acinetobacter baumannii]|uniref:low molecular weight protein-tyrosine-phosphatase n=1 Tax=Acinetobacter baumannii TaxID=470 RepID=UPI001D460761|nr:low molecular weight protein-tyrosine-phosphatase [Acinetobacter baumannii]MDC4685101.1 low molecular weight phosphotyrosine protein phosphatase [Acinetobacter baumannii]MDO6873386.1 low molecular weight phosphotyrosine protein phosphatase [Acinetobacter baumannii]MDO6884488.1 low molecular weight phosphotyrosine protein phosphatase [Acinetobacter baumannii]MDO6889478.1 low molecular weight phosphotyrosine protein phosphatase [Acinetobacter baumannii]MDO6904239.1 low molecular weight phosph
MQIKNILVVCIGNICRSPMAEYFLKQQYPQLNVESAGISGLIGHQADEKAQLCMQRLGIDMQPHIARKLNAELIKKADLILVMSSNQQKHIEQTWPFAKGKTYRLGHWQNKNVPDPYQHEQAVFDETCQLIQQCVADWKPYI